MKRPVFASTMPDENNQLSTKPIEILERRITLEDGRYMVFFTFTDAEGRDLSEGLHPWTEDRQGGVSAANERTTPSGPEEQGQPPLLRKEGS